MNRIDVAHLKIQGINVAVFAANGRANTDASRANVLADLTERAQAAGLHVEKSALAYTQGRRIYYYGSPDLVRYLSQGGVPRWTHHLDVGS